MSAVRPRRLPGTWIALPSAGTFSTVHAREDMEPEAIRDGGTDNIGEGAADLRRRMRAIEVAGVYRRQEELMDIAVTEDGLPRSFAEQVYDLSTEEDLPPAYGLALVAAGIGVEELVPPQSGDEESIQQDPPAWVTQGAGGQGFAELVDLLLSDR